MTHIKKDVITINDKLKIFVLSDSLGETGEFVIRAAISQFDTDDYEVKRFSHIKNTRDLDHVLSKLDSDDNVLLIYTLVKTELIEHMRQYQERSSIVCIDLLGPLIDILSDKLGMEPCKESGLNRRLDEEYFSRINAIEFAVKYDDGKDPRGFKDADLVLLGVSRTSKTPLSMYLANKGIKVANLPLVLETKPADEIFEIPATKVIGLTNSPIKLNEIREERLKSLGLSSSSSYTDMAKILEELEYADSIMKRIGCPIIDVSNKAIEETADIIISILGKNGVAFKK